MKKISYRKKQQSETHTAEEEKAGYKLQLTAHDWV